MKIKREYKVYLFEDEQLIDETCIDEHNEEFAWELFKNEFGHDNLNNTAYITFELIGFYDSETNEDVIIEEVLKEKRIDIRDNMPQFKITYADGEITQIEARDIEEAIFHAEDFDNEKRGI